MIGHAGRSNTPRNDDENKLIKIPIYLHFNNPTMVETANTLDVQAIRKHFPAIAKGRIVTNNAASTQAPKSLPISSMSFRQITRTFIGANLMPHAR